MTNYLSGIVAFIDNYDLNSLVLGDPALNSVSFVTLLDHIEAEIVALVGQELQ